jgi:YaiO family outer membrane protein
LYISAQTHSEDVTKAETEKSASAPKYDVQFNYSTESLSRDLGVWRVASLSVSRKFNNRQTVWANYRVSNRRSIGDREIIFGTYKPFKKRWAMTSEAMISSTHQFVGKFSIMGEVEKGFKNGVVAHFGTRYTSYNSVKATTGYGIAEKYWGSNRASYTLYVTKLTNAGTAPTHRFQYNRYYGERVNNFGATFSFGREHENLGPTLGILRSKTWSVSGSAKHWVNDKFALNFDATIHRQGKLYYRRGLNFGVTYRF